MPSSAHEACGINGVDFCGDDVLLFALELFGNLFINGLEQREAIFIECTRDGINLIDNNIIWNVEGRFDPAKIPAEPGSSGWYKMRELDVVNGYGIYVEGTDRLWITHNLIGRCRHSGYYGKPVSFRMHGMERGGTSRDAKITNNIFYDCGEAAIDFPTRDNEAEGNLYVRMQGGYLRVMYPEPEVCLNLPAWQEFLGFDQEGQNAWFDISVDDQTGEVTFSEAADRPHAFGRQMDRLHMIYRPEDVKKIKPNPHVPADREGKSRGETSLPGPFETWNVQ